MKYINVICYTIVFLLCSCNTVSSNYHVTDDVIIPEPLPQNVSFDSSYKSIHILVALCDNKYQGIVPVPAKIGNGQDAHNNLYWGCGYGIRTYFKKSASWKLVRTQKIDSVKLERLVFKHVTKSVYLILNKQQKIF